MGWGTAARAVQGDSCGRVGASMEDVTPGEPYDQTGIY